MIILLRFVLIFFSWSFLNILKKILKIFLVSNYILRNSQNYNAKETLRFEEKLMNLSQKDYVLTTCNGTLAIQTAIYANKILNKNIGCAINMIPSSYYPIKVTGNNIFPIGVDKDSLLISEEQLEYACKNKMISALIYCDFYGNYENINNVREICSLYNIPLIRDSSHSHHNLGKKEGIKKINETICYSFQTAKGVSAFEGGAICTSYKEIYISSLFYLGQNKFFNKCLEKNLENNVGLYKLDKNGYGIKGRINPLGSCSGLVDLIFLDFQNKLIDGVYQLSRTFLEKFKLYSTFNKKFNNFFSNGCKNILLRFNQPQDLKKVEKLLTKYGIKFYKRKYDLKNISNKKNFIPIIDESIELFDQIILINIDHLLSLKCILYMIYKLLFRKK